MPMLFGNIKLLNTKLSVRAWHFLIANFLIVLLSISVSQPFEPCPELYHR
jgi:hypothetical protein